MNAITRDRLSTMSREELLIEAQAMHEAVEYREFIIQSYKDILRTIHIAIDCPVFSAGQNEGH